MSSFLSQLMVGRSSAFLKAGGLASALLGISLSGCVLTEYSPDDCSSGRMETGCTEPPAQTCEASCASLREDTYLSCIDSGTHGEDCQVEALDAYDSCMVGACGTGDSSGTDGAIEPDPATDPSTGEGSTADDNGQSDESEPPADGSGSTDDGSQEPYPGDPSSPDSDCSYSCEVQASQFFEECMASGAPPEDCERKASSMWESCMSSCQPTEPPPATPPPSGSSDCSESCQAFAQGVYTECMVSTGDPVTCEDHAQLAAQSCMYGCQVGGDVEPVPTEPPPPQDCQASCEERSIQQFELCMESGQDADFCHMQLNDMLESCYASCNGEPVPPEPTDCQTECQYVARMQLDECLNSGADPERCEMQYQETLDACMVGCSGEQPPPASDCTTGCEEKARMEMESCLQSGGAPERCEALYQQTLEACVQSCAVVVTPVPVDQACLQACDERAMTLYNSCMLDGGDPTECKMLYQDAYESCAMSCG